MLISAQSVTDFEVSLEVLSQMLAVKEQEDSELAQLVQDARIYAFIKSTHMLNELLGSLTDMNESCDDDCDSDSEGCEDFEGLLECAQEKGLISDVKLEEMESAWHTNLLLDFMTKSGVQNEEFGELVEKIGSYSVSMQGLLKDVYKNCQLIEEEQEDEDEEA